MKNKALFESLDAAHEHIVECERRLDRIERGLGKVADTGGVKKNRFNQRLASLEDWRRGLDADAESVSRHDAQIAAIERRLEQPPSPADTRESNRRLQALENWRHGLDSDFGHESIRRFVEGLRELPGRVDRDHKLTQAHEGQLTELHRAVKDLQDLRERYENEASPLLSGAAFRHVEGFTARLESLEEKFKDLARSARRPDFADFAAQINIEPKEGR